MVDILTVIPLFVTELCPVSVPAVNVTVSAKAVPMPITHIAISEKNLMCNSFFIIFDF